MKTRIDQLLKGEFEYEVPPLLFSQEKVYVSLPPGETFRGEVYLGTDDERRIRGYITSSCRRLIPEFTEFSGTTVRLPYSVDLTGMEPGEKRTEWLCFTSSVGEYRLPFVIEAESKTAGASSSEIRTPEELSRLAEKDQREAFRLFTSPDFPRIMKDRKGFERSVSAGLLVQPVTYQSMEEFLISLNLKDKVDISIAEYRREIFGIRESTSDSVRITRSGPGYLRLEIEAEGDFIELEKKVITDEDFIGSICTLPYVILADRLGRGNNFGRIFIKSPYRKIVFEIEASREEKAGVDIRLTEKKRRLGLCRDYIDFRTGKIEASAFFVSSHYELNRLKESGCDYPEYILYEAFTLILEGKKNEAASLLEKYHRETRGNADPELSGIYLSLCVWAGITDDTANAVRRIRTYYKQREDSLYLALALLKLDPEYKKSPERSLMFMEELYEVGLRSPFLYLEAIDIIRKDMSLLRRLDRFWIQAFHFAAKQKYLTEELAMRFAYLCGYEKQYSECLYRTLALSYEEIPSDDTLEAICRYIMLDDPRRPEYFKWYSLGVKKGIRLTRLYEYYMETLDISIRKPLPRQILMYFNYNNTSMGDTRKAYIYASVTENRAADPESYDSYRTAMKIFAEERLYEGKISEDMAVLYRNFIPRPENYDQAKGMGAVCFCRRLYCDSPSVRTVIVRHYQLKREERYPLLKGVAYPVIYTDDAAVIFQDSRQRRYVSTIDYNMMPLLEWKNVLPEILDKGVLDPGLLLAYCESESPSGDNLFYYRTAAESDDFTQEYRDELKKRILKYYKEDPEGENMIFPKDRMDLKSYAAADCRTLLEVLTMRGMFCEAYEIIEEFGTEGLESASLLQITSRMILKNDMEEDDDLLDLASEVYRSGTYDETVLQYLMLHRNGPVDELLKIRKSALGFELDTYAFEEKLLCILMLTQDYRKEGETLFEHYERASGKERIVGAYLTQISYGYMVKDYSITPAIKQALEKSLRLRWPVNRICRYAFFKAVTLDKDPGGRYDNIKEELLKECHERGYTFSFFRRLPERMLSEYQLDDKSFLECHADPASSVTLFFQHDNGMNSDDRYRRKPVPMMYEGIYAATFTLFYGETLKYYFEIETDGEVRRTKERTIRMNRAEGEKGSKYQLINHLIAGHRLGKDQETVKELQKYLRQQQYVEQMFLPETTEQ